MLKQPEKYDLPYRPDTVLLCHANPLWNVPGDRNTWYEILHSMRFIVAIDIIPNETNEFADIILPAHDFFEGWKLLMNDAAHTEGLSLRQPVSAPLYDTKSDEDIFNELADRLGFLTEWNQMLNIAIGLQLKPELMLETDRRHTDKDIADRKARLWNGKDLNWYIEHGHSVTPRQPKKTYRPWEGLRLRFYIEDLLHMRADLKRKMEDAKVPIRHEWDWECYQPLPLPLIDPVLKEPAEFNLYAITFKEIHLNFAEIVGTPWIDDIVFRDPVHTTFLMNAHTGAEHGIADNDIVELASPYGRIFGRVALSQGVHHETVAISNALTRMASQNSRVKHGGGNFNELLPSDLRNTDACSSQLEPVARVKIRKLSALPQDVPANSVFAPKGRIH